jgi:Transglutaminase-like superfamily
MPIAFPPAPLYRAPLMGGDAGVSQTIQEMRSLVDQALRDPSILRTAKDIVRSVPAFDDYAEAQALYNWVRQNIRFTKDPVDKETLYPPSELLQIRAGDCDDISMLLGTLLMAIGYPARLMTVAANGDEFSHVYVEGQINGQWIPMDPARSDSQFGVAPPSYTRARWWSLSDTSQGDLPGTLGHYQRFTSHVSGMGSYGSVRHRTMMGRHRTMAFIGTPPDQDAVNDLTNNGYNPATVNQLIAMGATNEQLQALPFPTDPTSMQNAVNALVAQLGGTTSAPASAAAASSSGQITSSTIATVDQGIADIIRASQGQPASPYSYASGPYASFQTVNSPGLITAGYPAATTPAVSVTGSSDWLLLAAIGVGALMLMRH